MQTDHHAKGYANATKNKQTKHFLVDHLFPLHTQPANDKSGCRQLHQKIEQRQKVPTNNIFHKVAEEVSEIWANEVIPTYDQYYG